MVAGDGRGFVHRGLHLKSTGNDMDALLSSLTRKHWETGCSFNLSLFFILVLKDISHW